MVQALPQRFVEDLKARLFEDLAHERVRRALFVEEQHVQPSQIKADLFVYGVAQADLFRADHHGQDLVILVLLPPFDRMVDLVEHKIGICRIGAYEHDKRLGLFDAFHYGIDKFRFGIFQLEPAFRAVYVFHRIDDFRNQLCVAVRIADKVIVPYCGVVFFVHGSSPSRSLNLL